MLEKTQDTGEPCLKKKTIAVKMVPRNSVTEAVTNVIILSKSRRALAGYTLIGGNILLKGRIEFRKRRLTKKVHADGHSSDRIGETEEATL